MIVKTSSVYFKLANIGGWSPHHQDNELNTCSFVKSLLVGLLLVSLVAAIALFVGVVVFLAPLLSLVFVSIGRLSGYETIFLLGDVFGDNTVDSIFVPVVLAAILVLSAVWQVISVANRNLTIVGSITLPNLLIHSKTKGKNSRRFGPVYNDITDMGLHISFWTFMHEYAVKGVVPPDHGLVLFREGWHSRKLNVVLFYVLGSFYIFPASYIGWVNLTRLRKRFQVAPLAGMTLRKPCQFSRSLH